MKKILAIIMIALCLSVTAQESYTFSFDIGRFTIKQVDSVTVVAPEDQDYTCTLDPDGPALPMAIHRILNPYSTMVTTFNVAVTKRLIASDVLIEANGLPIATDQEIPIGMEPVMATASEMDAVSLLDGNAEQNGYSYSIWAVKPFLYDAVTKELYFVESVTLTPVQSTISRAGGADVVLRPDLFDADGMLNTAAFSTYPTMESRATADSEKFDYLIVAPESLIPAFDKFIKWKLQKGVRTKIVGIQSILSAESQYTQTYDKLKEYLYNVYKNNGISYVLLAGNSNLPYKTIKFKVKEEDVDEDYASDLYFASYKDDFTWNNLQTVALNPDIKIGRICIDDSRHLAVFIDKLLKYEKNPTTQDFAKKVLLAGCQLHSIKDGVSDSHAIGELLRNYIPSDVNSKLLFDTFKDDGDTFESQTFTNLINSNFNIIDVISHGKTLYWENNGAIMWGFSEISSLNNDMASIFLTSACYVNSFHLKYNNCLSNMLMKCSQAGAVAFIGSSGKGYTEKAPTTYSEQTLLRYSNLFEKEFFRNTYTYFSSNSGRIGSIFNSAKESLISMSRTNATYRYLSYAINLLGDPEMSVLTDNPSKISATVSRSEDLSKVTVSATALSGNITITDGRVEPEFYYVAKGKSTATFDIPSDEPFIVTVTGENCIPYEYRPYVFDTLHLHDCEIAESVSYAATKIILGKNVVVKSGATLKLTADEEFEIRDNIVCEKGAKLELKHKN